MLKKKLKYRYGIVSRDIILNPDVTLQAKALYAVLSCYANKQRSCFPSISTLSNDLNVSTKTINRLILELKNKNYIHRNGKNLVIK
jgi:hypothetical protein|tara:strand:- start:520 stop:777 length:258 start_codon:yes stop_codon:yes gene_type:complete